VFAPPVAPAGVAFNFTVTALDQFNNTATGYAGTVHFTSTDGQAVLPANTTLTNGTGTFSATLKTAGSQTITATDTVDSSITGTSNPIAVFAAAATHFAVSAPATAHTTTPFNFTVTALDQFNNTATGYLGTVHFTSSDFVATLPADSTLTNGTGTFSATLFLLGNQTITATDTVDSSITGTSNTITVG
jgi:predicted RNA methylase